MTARHAGIRGFAEEKLARAWVLAVGAGGIVGWVGCGLVRKGIGTLYLCDGDEVELSNLNRQLFTEHDLYKNKAERLARNLSRQGFCGTELIAYPYMFEELLELSAVLAVCVKQLAEPVVIPQLQEARCQKVPHALIVAGVQAKEFFIVRHGLIALSQAPQQLR